LKTSSNALVDQAARKKLAQLEEELEFCLKKWLELAGQGIVLFFLAAALIAAAVFWNKVLFLPGMLAALLNVIWTFRRHPLEHQMSNLHQEILALLPKSEI